MNAHTPVYGTKIFWSDVDHCYVATCPELEGSCGLGDSREEALAHLSLVLDLFVETCVEEGTAAPLAAVQPSPSGQFRLRLPRSLHLRLSELADLEGVSLNTLAVTLLAQGVGGRAGN